MESWREVADADFWRLATDSLLRSYAWMTLALLNVAHRSSSDARAQWLEFVGLARDLHGRHVDLFLPSLD